MKRVDIVTIKYLDNRYFVAAFFILMIVAAVNYVRGSIAVCDMLASSAFLVLLVGVVLEIFRARTTSQKQKTELNEVQVTSEIWPNFFIVGAARAGTTTLYEALSRIPGIYMAPFKEPEYFAPNSPTSKGHRYYSHKSNYIRLFEHAKNAIAIGEASTAYLWDPEAPTSIYKKLPHAKIIAILRNPIERAYSDYLQDIHLRNIRISFEEALHMELDHLRQGASTEDPFSYIRNGFYSAGIEKYYSLFGECQVKIVIFEDYVKNTKATINEILEFLGVSYDHEVVTEKYNSFVKPRNALALYLTSAVHTSKLVELYNHLPFTLQSSVASMYKKIEQSFLLEGGDKQEMSPEAREILKKVFDTDVRRLKEILKRKLPWEDFET